MVSPSVPEMCVTIVEGNHAIVALDVATPQTPLNEAAPLVNRGVRIQFEHGQWVRTYPAATDVDPVPRDVFDWSGIEFRGDRVGDGGEWLKRFRAQWARQGTCPNPSFYEALESRWIEEENACRFGCRHFVLVGHDMWMEVLCTGMSWAWRPPDADVAAAGSLA